MTITPVRVEAAGEAPTEVEVRFGAAEFHLAPKDMAPLLEGEFRGGTDGVRSQIIQNGNRVCLRQRGPVFLAPPFGGNEWNLAASTRRAMKLRMDAAAFRADLDLTGVPLADFYFRAAAADARVRFGALNPERMPAVTVSTAASSLEMDGLLNANFDRLYFEGIAGRYRLNFAGPLARNTFAQIRASLCDLMVEVPRGTPVQLSQSGVLASAPGGVLFGTREQASEATNSGRPALRISVSIALGNFQLIEV